MSSSASDMDYYNMTIRELMSLVKARGLGVTGPKTVLIESLEKNDAEVLEAESIESDSTLFPEVEEEAEEEEEEESGREWEATNAQWTEYMESIRVMSPPVSVPVSTPTVLPPLPTLPLPVNPYAALAPAEETDGVRAPIPPRTERLIGGDHSDFDPYAEYPEETEYPPQVDPEPHTMTDERMAEVSELLDNGADIDPVVLDKYWEALQARGYWA